MIAVLAKSGLDQWFDDLFAQWWAQAVAVACAVLVLLGVIALVADGFSNVAERRRELARLRADLQRVEQKVDETPSTLRLRADLNAQTAKLTLLHATVDDLVAKG